MRTNHFVTVLTGAITGLVTALSYKYVGHKASATIRPITVKVTNQLVKGKDVIVKKLSATKSTSSAETSNGETDSQASTQTTE